jgi:hypothetical protein
MALKLLKRFYAGDKAAAAHNLERILNLSYAWNPELTALLCPPTARHAHTCRVKITASDKALAKSVSGELMNVVEMMRQSQGGHSKQLVPEETLQHFVEQWMTNALMDAFGPIATCGVLRNCLLPALRRGESKPVT